MNVGRLIVISAAAAVLDPACASNTGALKEGGPQIALRRGGGWTTFTVNPPTILGSTAQLRLEGQTLGGFVGTSSLHVKIDNDKASGFGPSGPIDVRIRQEEGDVGVDGLWNGGPVHLVFAPTRLKGSVTRWGGMIRQATCGYDLDHRGPDGAFIGTSICEGMPEPTRFEIDERVRGMLKPPELAILLVAILASPAPAR